MFACLKSQAVMLSIAISEGGYIDLLLVQDTPSLQDVSNDQCHGPSPHTVQNMVLTQFEYA